MAKTIKIPGIGNHKIGTYHWEKSESPKPCGYEFKDERCIKKTSPHYCAPRVQAVCDFFEDGLCLIDGDKAGTAFKLSGWHLDAVRKLYGVVVYDDELNNFVRRYKVAWIVVGRKNAKSTLLAGLSIMHLRQGGHGGQIVAAAQSKTQAADYLGDMIERMIAISPAGEAAGVYSRRGQRAGFYSDANTSTLKLITSDAMKSRGMNPTCAVMDEVLAIPNAEELASVWQDAWGTKPGPVMICATTPHYNSMSYERKQTRLALDVKENPDLDPTFLPLVYQPEPTDDLWSEQAWLKANPGCAMGIKSLNEVRQKALKAKGDPTLEVTFLREQVCTPTAEGMYYVPLTTWRECKGDSGFADLRERLKSFDRVWAGVDLSAAHDLSSLAIVGYDSIKRKFVLAQWSWIPERVRAEFTEQLLDKPKEWIKSDALRTLPAGDIGIEVVGEQMIEILKEYPVEDVGLDVWRVQQLRTRLNEEGIPNNKVGQGYHLTPAILQFRDVVMEGRVEHGGDPVLQYAIESAKLKEIYGDKFTIEKQSRDNDSRRVDPLVATLTAIMRVQVYSEERSVSGISLGGGVSLRATEVKTPSGKKPNNRFGII